MRIKLSVSGLVLLLVLLAGGLSAWRSRGLTPDPRELRLAVKALPGTLDWNRSSSPSDVNYPVILAIMRGLTRLDHQGQAQPDLARSWEVALTPGAQPRMILTFHLGQACWSDGRTPLTAQDFVFAWRRAALGVDGGEMQEVAGVAELNRARDEDPGMPAATLNRLLAALGVEAVANDTLRVTLTSPHVEFLQRLAQVYVFYPAPSQDLAGRSEAAIRAYFDAPQAGKPMVLGPYRPESWDHLRGLIRLVRNPVANPAPAAPDHVTFLQSALEAVLYARGKADFLQVQDPRDLWSPAADLRHCPLLSTAWLGFNTARVPLGLRQAIAWGLDRPRLLATVFPQSRPAFGLLPHDLGLPGAVGPDEALGRDWPRFDALRARAFLAASGFDRRERLLLLVPKESLMPGEGLARAIRQQLRDLGLDVEIVASSQFSQDLATLRPHLFLRRTGADYFHPNSLFVPQTRNGANGVQWKDLDGGRPMAELERLLGEGSAQTDPTRMREIYAQAQDLLLARWAVLVPLYYPDRYFRCRPRVHGLAFDPYNILDLRAVTLEAS
jgi:peptide/nickel transport system substrate-binding protein